MVLVVVSKKLRVVLTFPGVTWYLYIIEVVFFLLLHIFLLMSSSSHIRRVEISGEPRNFHQTLNVYLLSFFSADHPHSE